MTRLSLASLLLGSMLASAAQAQVDCAYPRAPTSMPDGVSATQQEMLDAMQAVKTYNDAVSAYLACIEQALNERLANPGEVSPEQLEQLKAIHTKRHNAAVDALEDHAARFNEQVKLFKERDKRS